MQSRRRRESAETPSRPSSGASRSRPRRWPPTAISGRRLNDDPRGARHAFPEDFHVAPEARAASSKTRASRSRARAPSTGRSPRRSPSARSLLEGTPVRLGGPGLAAAAPSASATPVFYDVGTGEQYIPLKHLAPDQARFDVFDSSLSRVRGARASSSATASADPLTLVLWEAQFGDFVNGAQIMIDQFIAGSRDRSGASQRPGAAAAARLRGPGPGALERAHRALPAALRRGQHAGRQPDDAGAVLPPAAPPGARDPRAQAARRLHAEEPAAPPARRLDARRARRRRASSRCSTTAASIPRAVAPRGPLLGQGLLRPAAAREDAKRQRRRASSASSSSTRSRSRARRGAAALPAAAEVVWARKSRATWAPGASCASASWTATSRLGPHAALRGAPGLGRTATGSLKGHLAEQDALVEGSARLTRPRAWDQGPIAAAPGVPVT